MSSNNELYRSDDEVYRRGTSSPTPKAADRVSRHRLTILISRVKVEHENELRSLISDLR